MKVTVSKSLVSRTSGAPNSLRLAACACLASIAVVAEGARYEELGNVVPGPANGGVTVGESILAPGHPPLIDESESYSQSMASDGMHDGSVVVSDGQPLAGGPCFSGVNDCHPGIFGALYDRHLDKLAQRDAAGLPEHSTSGLVNRILGPADPRWTAQVDALFLWWQPLQTRTLFLDPAGAPALNTGDVRSDVGIGPRAALMLNLDCIDAIEANYFNVRGINGLATLPPLGNGTLYSLNDVVGYNFADIGDAEVTSTGAIQSFELNWRRWNTGAVTWLVGARWVEWNEGLSIVDSYVPVDPLEPGGTDSFNVQTRNDLYGAQIGGDVLLWNSHKLVRFNAVGKAGVFANSTAQQQTQVTSDREPFEPIAVSASGTNVAFFGELGINGSLKLTEWLWWRAGYNFFWLSGVATAAGQLSVTDPGETPPLTGINTNGSLLLHGANTGLEARW